MQPTSLSCGLRRKTVVFNRLRSLTTRESRVLWCTGKGPGLFGAPCEHYQMISDHIWSTGNDVYTVLECFGEVVSFSPFRWNIMETILMVSSFVSSVSGPAYCAGSQLQSWVWFDHQSPTLLPGSMWIVDFGLCRTGYMCPDAMSPAIEGTFHHPQNEWLERCERASLRIVVPYVNKFRKEPGPYSECLERQIPALMSCGCFHR